MVKPYISYINSCYNAEPFLNGFIENMLKQSEDDFEIIIVDSQSNDKSIEIAKKWQAQDDRIRIIQQPVRTPYGVSWLDGWKEARGMIVANSNSDDLSYPWRHSQVKNTAMARRITRMVHPPAFYYGGYETRINGSIAAWGSPPPFSVEDMSQFFRCGVHIHWDNGLRNKVDWDLMYRRANEYKSAFDYWLVLYFMSLGAVGVPIKNCFSIYNQRPDSLEQSDKERNTFESLRAIEEFYPYGKSILALENETRVKSPEFYERYRTFCSQFK